MNTVNLSKATVVLAALFLSGTALAQSLSSGADDKITTGASCEALSNTQLGDFYYRPTSIQNISAGFRYVACPVLIDSEETWDLADNNGVPDSGSGILHLILDYSQAAGGTTTCTAQIIGSGATFIETKSASVVGAAGASAVALTISGLLNGNANANALGFNCNLPPMVMLRTINIEEYASTHNEQTP